MTPTTLATGLDAENLACDFLIGNGLSVIERNYHCRRGEIDLIMEHNQTVAFVEVRFRKNTQFGTPAETVNFRKQSKLILAAQHFLHTNPGYSNRPGRFDIIAISGQKDKPQIDWIQDAFQS